MVSLLPCLLFVWLPIAAADYIYTPCETCTDRATTSELANISFCVFPNNNLDEYTCVLVGEATNILDYIDSSKPTVIYIFGWTESMSSTSVRTIFEAYFIRADHNVVLLNWEDIASGQYLYAYKSIPGVGYTAAYGLNDLVAAGLNLSSLHVVGHSLGGQIAGYLGRNTNVTIPRITGLDPAGPGFYLLLDDLKSGDANFVDVIHTDSGVYGTALANGDVDFYPNCGTRIQPGCLIAIPLSDDDFCSHHRSWYFYAESLLNENVYMAVQCSSLVHWLSNNCSTNDTAIMGYATPTDLSGKYYLQTNSASPYGRGESGATFNLTLYLTSLSL